MKTCYISDLDGTLLGSDVKLSDFTRSQLSILLAEGISFTVATARSPYSVRNIFEGINITLPLILMNGAILYDLKSDEIISYAQIPALACDKIVSAVHSAGLTAFAYEIRDKMLHVSHEELTDHQMRDFHDERVSNYGKRFERVDRLEGVKRQGIIYFTMLYPKEDLLPLHEIISSINGVSCSFYNDIYSDMWYLEIFSDQGSKYNGAQYIRENYGFDRLVAFGDSENDIPLFEACDLRCAVENACDVLKGMADVIIGDNTSDGVVKYISSDRSIK